MLTLATSSTSPPAGAEDDGALWIALGDARFPATHLRVTTNVVKEGKGRNKRGRYVCNGSLYSGNSKLEGYTRVQKAVKLDPRAGNEEAVRDVRETLMDIFIKPQVVRRHVQKRGKRAARDVSGVRNDCIVVYGLFDADIKPSAHHYNLQRLDAEMPRCTLSSALPCMASGL